MRSSTGAMWGAVMVVAAGLGAATAHGQIIVPGADGSDGALNVTANQTINLGLANTGAWNSTPAVPGNGVYDPEKWAVVYRYASVTIGAGRTLTFSNHPSRAPVVWLVSGDVTINTGSTLSLDGAAVSTNAGPTEPGPGGFRGGERCQASNTPPPSGPGSAGFGPGGGNHGGSCATGQGGAGGHASAGSSNGGTFGGDAYGSITGIPLMGGSGGARSYNSSPWTGGSGGGAILIAAQGTITINGRITASANTNTGFAWGGAGGTIRVVCATLAGTGRLDANGASGGGQGLNRVEANVVTLPVGNFSPATTPVPVAGGSATIFAPDTAAFLTVTQVGTSPVSADAYGRSEPGLHDVTLLRPGLYQVLLRLRNLNPAQSVVQVRAVPLSGAATVVNALLVSGTTQESIWRATVPFARGATVIMGTGSRVVGTVQQPTVFSREVSGYSFYCWADLDNDGDLANGGAPDGAVTIDDLLFFLSAFETGDVAADLDENGIDPANPDGGVTIDDLLFFLTHFEAGC